MSQKFLLNLKSIFKMMEVQPAKTCSYKHIYIYDIISQQLNDIRHPNCALVVNLLAIVDEYIDNGWELKAHLA